MFSVKERETWFSKVTPTFFAILEGDTAVHRGEDRPVLARFEVEMLMFIRHEEIHTISYLCVRREKDR